ncbi:ROK family protein [Alteromonas flava]|uniref:ROK family protein n=1 Tax=Alteromonas flava TaxID=2048003 RepID=UPI000C29297C|nr:ROK family protein [Alteromonas flava]
MSNAPYVAAIEAGGTKFNCALVDANRNIIAQQRVATTTPDKTIGEAIQFFQRLRDQGFDFARLGLACFGPLDLQANSDTFGSIARTPKPEWSNTPIKQWLERELQVPVALDTDVNAAALAESLWGAAQHASVAVYVTVGTGVGVGVVINGQTLKGLVHPEVGHWLVPKPTALEGQCPFHGSCIEGLASGTSMRQIWQTPAHELPLDHPAWDAETDVLALLCHNLMLAYSPFKIIIGGGVMARAELYTEVARKTAHSLADYLVLPQGVEFSDIIQPPGLSDKAGILGAYALTFQ